jgi:thioredoxin-related protein
MWQPLSASPEWWGRALKRFSLLLFFLGLGPALVWSEALTPLTDLQSDGRQSRQQRIPLLLVFTAENCLYCHRLKKAFLLPMERSGDYTTRVLIREVPHDQPMSPVTGFEGEALAVEDLSTRYRIRVTPTMVFLDAAGQEVAERMVGLSGEDFFGYYLEENIDTANLALQQR